MSKKLKIYLINGVANSGKDTFVNLTKELIPKNWNVINISSVVGIKKFLGTHISNFNPKEKVGHRQLISDIEDAFLGSGEYQHYVEFAFLDKLVFDFKESKENMIIFIHARKRKSINFLDASIFSEFPEAECKKLLIERPNLEVVNCTADKETSNIPLDFYDINYSSCCIHMLRNNVKKFIKNEVLSEED